MKKHIFLGLVFISFIYLVISCKPKTSDAVIAADGNFPADVANIIVSNCAAAGGCHNVASYQYAANLLLDNWDHLFRGDVQGAVVVPYCTTYSLLFYTVNTDSLSGPCFLPDANHSKHPLSRAESITLYNWIKKGAPDRNGNIAFASDPDTRQKIYLSEQGNDVISVIDAKSMLVMRYISVGLDPSRYENPHCVAASADGKSVYVSFYAGQFIQKIDTRTDTVIGTVDVGNYTLNHDGSWNVVFTSPVSDELITTNLQPNASGGSVAVLSGNPFRLEAGYDAHHGITFVNPHGVASNASFDTFYIAGEYGNVIYRFYPKFLASGGNFVDTFSIDSTQGTATAHVPGITHDPHYIEMAPDYSKYFVTCQETNEVRVIDVGTRKLLKVIPVGTKPQESAISVKTGCIYVACIDDRNNPSPNTQGSVYVIDYTTYAVKAILYGDFFQPHDLCVDERDGLLFIPSSNSNPDGPASHHPIPGSDRPGWYSVYDLYTLKPVNRVRYEVPAFPYSICTRFKQ